MLPTTEQFTVLTPMTLKLAPWSRIVYIIPGRDALGSHLSVNGGVGTLSVLAHIEQSFSSGILGLLISGNPFDTIISLGCKDIFQKVSVTLRAEVRFNLNVNDDEN